MAAVAMKTTQPVMLTRTFHQGPGPGQGLHSQGPGQGSGFEYNDQDKDKDLSKCGHISVNIPANFDNSVSQSTPLTKWK